MCFTLHEFQFTRVILKNKNRVKWGLPVYAYIYYIKSSCTKIWNFVSHCFYPSFLNWTHFYTSGELFACNLQKKTGEKTYDFLWFNRCIVLSLTSCQQILASYFNSTVNNSYKMSAIFKSIMLCLWAFMWRLKNFVEKSPTCA